MKNVHFDLFYQGQVLEGAAPADVMPKLAALLKLPPDKAAALFTGKTIIIKRNADKATASKFVAAFRKVGAVLIAREKQPTETSTPITTHPPETTTSPWASTAPPPTPRAPTSPKAHSTTPNADAAHSNQYEAHISGESDAWSVADPGTVILKPDERTVIDPLDVETSHMSVAEAGADVLRPEERSRVEPVTVDIAGMTMLDSGADLLAPEELDQFVERELDLSEFSVSEVGTDVLMPNERAAEVPPPIVDFAKFNVEEPGAILVTEPKPPPPPAPDVSHISLDTPARENASPSRQSSFIIDESDDPPSETPPPRNRAKASFIIDDTDELA